MTADQISALAAAAVALLTAVTALIRAEAARKTATRQSARTNVTVSPTARHSEGWRIDDDS